MSTTLGIAFNSHKVHIQLASILPAGIVKVCHVDRYSLLEADGIVTQVAVTTSRYSSEPAVRAYANVDPADAALWEPANIALLRMAVANAAKPEGLNGNAVWVMGQDVHPNSRHNDVVAALILIGDTLFVRATTSAVKRAIHREDGADENVYTVLLNQLVRHYKMDLIRWDEDVTRATRDDLSSVSIIDTCLDAGTLMQFGLGQMWDPCQPESKHVLTIMLGQGSVDDGMRRRKLMGKRIFKAMSGGWPWSESQLPQGYVLKRDGSGRPVKEEGKGAVPEPSWDMVPTIQHLWQLHSKGVAYVELGEEMARLGVLRRCQMRNVASYAELMASGDRVNLGDSAKSFFVNVSANPHTARDVYLQKVELLKTGVFHTRVANEIRGAGITVAGLAPQPPEGNYELGYFDVNVSWGFPVDPATGESLRCFGLTSAELEASRRRLIDELSGPRQPTGGAAHARRFKRAIRPTPWRDGDRDYGVMSRRTNSGKYTDIVLTAQTSDREARGRKGWAFEAQHPAEHCIWTYASSDLCGSVSRALETSVSCALKDEEIARFVVTDPPADQESLRRETRIRVLRADQESLAIKAAQHQSDARALDLSAARALEQGKVDKRDELDARADGEREAAAAAERRVGDIDGEIAALEIEILTSKEEEEAHVLVDLSVAAYMVEGFRRAAGTNGLGPAALAQIARQRLVDWRMEAGEGGEGIRWRCTALIPLVAGGSARLDLSGLIDNVRLPQGGRHDGSQMVLAHQLLFEGRPVDEVMQACHVRTSRKAVMTCRLMPFLRDRGVVSVAAKNALVDHPVVGVQQIVYGRITGECVDADRWPEPLRSAILEYYLDPDAEGGFAACLDDTVLTQRVLTTLAQNDPGRDGIRVELLALGGDSTDDGIRDLAAPRSRNGAQKRPRFLETHPRHRDRVRLFSCPYCPARDRAVADRVLYLPEVAQSGYGVVCGRCGRVPVPASSAEHARWKRVVFGAEFTERGLITRIAYTTLREEPQTGFVVMPPALALPAPAAH